MWQEAAVAVVTVLGCPVVLYALARWVGLGRCMQCGGACAPWDAYCGRHRP